MQRELTLLLRTLYDDRGARAVLGDLSRVQDALRGTESSALGAGQALSALLAGGVGGAVGAGLMAALGSVQSVLGSIAGLAEGFVRSAIQASMQMEQLRFGLATVLGAWNEIRDAQGRVLTGAERYNALLSLSGELMRSIRAEANRTILETAELIELVQTGLGYAYAKGLSADQAVRVISAIGQAGKLMGLSGPMLVQEVRALLGGGRLESSQVALSFGITREMLERSGQELAEALLRALSSVTDAASMAADRLDVQWSTLTSQVQEALAQVGDGLTGGLAQFLKQLNEVLGQLLESGVFERLGIFLRLLWQALVEGVGSLVEGVRGVWSWLSGVVSRFGEALRNISRSLGLEALWKALPAGVRDFLGGVASALIPPALRQGMGLGGAIVQAVEGYRVAWDVAGMMAGRGGGGGGDVRVVPRRVSVGGGADARAARERAARDRARERLAREGAQAAQIERRLRAGAYEEAWSGLLEVLTPETAEVLTPVLEAIEVELAGLRAAEVLSQIGQETSGRLREALSAQAWEEYRRVLAGYASRRASVLARGVAERERAREAEAERAAQLEARRRQLLRGLYAALGDEDAVLRMEYEDAVRAWLEAGVSPLWAGIYGAVQVYAPVQRRREELRRRDTEAFLRQLREFGERARAEELRRLTRRFRAGLMSVEDYARALRRLAGAGRLDEGSLETLAAGLRGSVEAGLPEARLFEDAESFRARWLAALSDMRAYWGQFLERLLRPEEYGRVMEVFDELAVEFDRRFVRVASARWSEFVEGLVGALASGVRGAFVGLLEAVMADFRRLGEGLRGFFEGIVGLIRRAIAELVYERVIRAWVERLLDWLQQRLGGLGVGDGGGRRVSFGDVLTSIAIAAFTSWVGGQIGGWLGKVFKFQAGGALVPRRVALVGEQGPELLVMGAGAYGGVYPASLLEQVRFGSGAPSAVQITVQVSDFSEVGLARRVATEVRRVLRERGV
jgi:hypothetical protein